MRFGRALAVLLALGCAPAQALPVGGEVVAGEASISQQGPVMQVEQTSQRAIINYQDFNIAADETVNFNQPNAQAVVLNRVVGGNLAEIYGHMNANGQVYLVNPNGVLIGQGAELNVGGLMVTSLDMRQADFLAGREQLEGASSGRVENQGHINAEQAVILVAPEVINGGRIQAPEGAVALGATHRALLHTPGSGIPILVDEAELAAGLQGQLVNTGRIEAAAVSMGAAGEAPAGAIRNSGVVRAVRASGAGGVIELLAPSGEVNNSGSLDASAAAGAGGRVDVAAARIAQSGHISAAAAGAAGDGGVIELRSSDSLALFGESALNADAAQSGKGGDVWVVAEKDAWFTDTAHISARGGAISGDGGFVEFSGHQAVSVNGWVDVSAVNGKAGMWYIDPTNILITNTDSNGGFTGGNPKVWTFTGSPATSQINVVGIENTLTNGSNVTINTASGAASAGNITWNGTLDMNGFGTVRTLTLIADGSVTFQSGNIWDSNLATATDGLNINVTAGTGITVADGVGINGTLGKLNFTATTGDATITGLGSTANASDAIRVTASAGRILDGGDTFYDATALVGSGGVQLSARDGINIETNANSLDLQSSNGNVSLVNLGAANVSRLSALTTSYLATGGALQTNNATVFGGTNVQLLSGGSIVLPSNGMSVSGNLTLQGNDIVDQNGARTLSIGAGHLIVNSAAAGGNSIFNTSVNQLSVSNVSTNSLTFNDSNGLTTVSVSPFSGTTTINSGAGADLIIGSQIELNDETGTLNFNAGKDLYVNGAVADSVGAISNNNSLNFTAVNNVIFDAAAVANAGAGSVAVSVTNGNISLSGAIAGASMSFTAAGASAGNITSNASIDLNGFGAVRTLNLNASGVISFTGGTIADSDTNTASDGLNINATAGTGFSVSDGAVLAAGAGKINITTTLGNASVTGLSSSANAADAIQVTASGGSILDGGNSRTDLSASAASGGAILSGQFGITGLETDISVLDARSTAGDISLTEAGGLSISRVSALDSSSVTASGAILTTNSTVFGGNDLNLISSSYIQVPLSGITMADLVLLQAADVRAEGGLRTMSLGGHHVFVDTASTGGNLLINSTTDLLTLKNTGTNIITLNDADALLLASVRPQSGSMVISSGAGSDLTLANAPIELNGSNGSLTLSAGRDLLINQVMADTIGALDNATTISLNATNNITFTSGGRVNAGTGTVSLNATGGDIALGRVDAASSTLTAAGAITDANGALVNLTGTSASLSAGTSIGAVGDLLDTTLNSLSLTASNGGAYLANSQGLSLTSASVNGDFTLNLPTSGNLTLVQSAPVINGAASFNLAAGQLVIPDAGWTTAGNLTISATNLVDSNNDISLSAAAANITLSNAASNRSWATSFTSLALGLTGAGDFSLTDSNGLTLGAISTGGNASFTTSNADLSLAANTSVAGTLSLATTGSGNVIVPVAGLTQSAGLSINARDLLDTDRTLSLGASNATITLRGAASSMQWNTAFDTLTLALTGGGSLSLTDSSALTLLAASSTGNSSFTTTNGDLTLSADPAITGNLSLITTGSGNVNIPSGGLSQPAGLTINAADLLDTDRDLTLAASSASITLRSANAARSWATSFNDLTLALTGSGDFALTDSNALTLTSASTGGNASFTASNADLTLASDPAVAGNLSLLTTGTGNVIIPLAGLSQAAGLTLNANDVLDTDRNISLSAGAASITLRDNSAARSWATAFTSLNLNLSGSGAFSLTDSDALSLTAATSGGAVSLTTTGADLTLTTDTSVSGTLSLITTGSGNVVLPLAGFTQLAGLSINANDLLDTDRNLTLAATSASITLRNATAARSWATAFNDLTLALSGGGDLALTDSNALTLISASSDANASFTTTNADLTLSGDPAISGNLSLITTGTGNVIIPLAGLTQTAGLTINANDILDTDRDLTLAATSANITLRNAASARNWATSFTDLSLALTGTGDFALTDSDALTLSAINTGGSASFTTTNADLTLSAAPTVGGSLSLSTTGSGNLIIPLGGLSHAGVLTINANDLLDTDRDISLAATNADISLRSANAARTWNTSFNNLSLALAGSGDFSLTDSNALTLTSATTGGNASFTTTNADLTLSGDPVVSGNLSLVTTGTGNVIIPVAGITQPAGLTINANDVLDTDRDLTLAATSANITLRNAASARNWATSFTDLSLALTGAGDFALTDSDALTLSAINTGGSASFTSSNADLTLSAAPSVGGSLSLSTTGSGNLIIPLGGLSHAGVLTINANDLLDTDRDISLAATNADISLRSANAARTWNTSFNNLSLALTGSGDFALTDSNALTLTSTTTGGNASFTTTNADLTLSSDPVVSGNLSLVTTGTGNVIIPLAGITQPAGLTINANDVLDTDRDLTLVATNAAITLRNANSARSWATSFTDLSLALTGAGDFSLVDSDGLTLSAANSGGNVNLITTNADLTLAVNTTVGGTLSLTTTGTGNLILPVAGFTQSAGLTVNANDLLDTDRDVTLAATSANITLRNSASARNWVTSFNDLILSLTGSGDFALTDSNALTLTSATTGGNASFTTTNADLTLGSDPAVSGNLSLITTGTGNVIIPLTGLGLPAGLTINTNDILDTDRDLTLAATNAAITLRNAASARSWTTSFTDLSLALTGAGDFTLVDSDGLTLSAASSGGNVNLTTTNADLTLSANTTVGGTLSLTTTGAGNVILPAAGFIQSAGLTVNANDLLDADRELTLAATSANITLRNAASSRNWATSFNDLILALTGSGDFALIDSNALTLTSATTGGNASFTATNADLTLSSDPAVSGNLSLITTGTGNVIIPLTGLGLPAGLTINANDLLDTDRTLTLAATDASINLRGATAAHTWASSFNTLNLSLTGSADFALVDSNALTLTSVTTSGNASFTTTNADLTLASNPAVSGNLSLITTGSGNVIIPLTGLGLPAGLTINANDLLDTDRDLTLSASSANITLRNAASNRNWATSFNDLILALTGSGDFALTDSSALTLTSATTGGNASFTTTNADLTLSSNPAVSGNLSLITTGTGNVIIPQTGLGLPAGLTINANDLLDTDRTLTLGASDASINLRNATAAHTIASSFDSLDLTLRGGGDFVLNDSDGLILLGVNSDGDTRFTTTNADLNLAALTSFGSNLNLATTGSGTIILPTAGVSISGALSIDAMDLIDTDRDISLAANSATINLRGATQARSWLTDFASLSLQLSGAGDFTLTDNNGLNLTSVTTDGSASFTATNNNLTLTTNPQVGGNLTLAATGSGAVIIPDAGLSSLGNLTINASDLRDTDTALVLAADNATINVRNAVAARSWATDFNRLNLTLSGGGGISLTNSDALIVDGLTTDGAAAITTTLADLTLANNPSVGGELQLLTTGLGNVIIPTSGVQLNAGLRIDANDLLDSDRNLSLAATDARIQLRDAQAARRWSVDFDQLNLTLNGPGNFSLTDTDGLILTAANLGGDSSFTTTNADLTLAANPSSNGQLNLSTTGTGRLIVPSSGIAIAGALTLNAADLLDSDHSLNLTASTADITLRNANASHTWATDFNQLNLAVTGGGDLVITDANGLSLNSVTTDGNASFNATAADLLLLNTPQVAGRLSLTASGAGNVRIPTTGMVHSGALVIDANDLLDTDRDISLAATNADISLRSANAARRWATDFDHLALTLTGAGDLSLVDANGLTLDAASSSANLAITTTNADLTLPATTQVGGNLTLTATGAGNILVPVGGFTQLADLSLNAQDIRDTDRDISMAANHAAVNLRGATGNRNWQTQLNQLSLALLGGGNLALVNNADLTLAAVSSPADVRITVPGAISLTANPAVAGTLSLMASGALVIPTTGISQLGALTIDAQDIVDGDLAIQLAAPSAAIHLHGANPLRIWATAFNDLALQLDDAGTLNLIDSDGLSISRLSTPGNLNIATTNADLTLTANTTVAGQLSLVTRGSGNVVIPSAGFRQAGALSLTADDLLDGDTDVSLAASAAAITLRNANGRRSWQSDFAQLDLALTGAGDFALTNAGSLSLNGVATANSATFTAGGDLTLLQNPTVGGRLALTASGAGRLIIPAAGLNHSGVLALSAADIVDTDTDISLQADSASIQLRAAVAGRNWQTQFNSLALDLSGGGALHLTNSGPITLNGASSAGALTVATNNAAITLAADSQVAGGLNLLAAGSGSVYLPERGFTQRGALSIEAFDLLDSDHSVQLGADAAVINLRSSAARSWNTDLASLGLSLSGPAAFSLSNARSLSLGPISTQGDAQFRAQGDLSLTADPAVAGTLSLITQGSGTLRLPATGLSQPGLLVIDALDLADDDRAVNLAATRAQINLRNPAAALVLNTHLEQVDLTAGGPFAISLNDADDLSLGALNTAGDLAISSVGNLEAAGASLSIGGRLSLAASEQLRVSAEGISLPPAPLAQLGLAQLAPSASGAGSIRIVAAGIAVAGGGPLHLAAHSADISLSGNQPVVLAGQLDELALGTQTDGAVALSNDRDLNLLSLSSPQASSLSLAIQGALQIPISGLNGGKALAIKAVDLFDDDRTLSLVAEQLQVALSNTSGQNLWNLTADTADIALAGSADLSLKSSQGLILGDLNGDGKSLWLTDGNLALSLAAGDLSIRADLISQDASNDSRQAGRLDISLAAGSISSQGSLTISAQQASAQPPGSFALSMVLTDTSAADRSIRLGAGTQVVAVGGDILFDTRPQATAAAARRTYVQEAASPSAAAAQVSAYTNQSDPSTGRVTLNGAPILASAQQRIGTNRWLAIVADAESSADYGGALEQTQDLSQVTKALEQPNKSGFTVDEQFGKVFGDCDEFDPKTRNRCKVNSALKAFLSHWLVGGELPSKREQN